jgi:hypothetical protein
MINNQKRPRGQSRHGRPVRRTKCEIEAPRGEFGPPEDPDLERNANEHPEQAYRRGYQQGAHAVLDPLRKAKLLDHWTQRKLENFVYWKIFDWRYAKRRRLSRHICKDRAPTIDLTTKHQLPRRYE